jgi:hypothetical protein
MRIDMATLKAVTFGDPESKMQVKRAWLKEVYEGLVEGASYKQKYMDLQRACREQGIQITTSTIPPAAQRDLDEGVAHVNKGVDKIFGQGGAFDKIFGKSNRRGR